MGYIIQTENLSKEYLIDKRLYNLFLHPLEKDKILALNDINIKITRSEFVYLLGLNGAGKTTLLKILCGILLPTAGKIQLRGIEVKDTQELKNKIGFASGEDRSFYWRLTAKENLEFFGTLYGMASQDLTKRLKKLLCLFGIPNPDRKFYEYSSGFKQRLCIIKALLHDPEILLLDEPAKSLDDFARDQLLSCIKERLTEEQKTVVIGTSNLGMVGEYDKVIILRNGKIIAEGHKEEIKEAFRPSI